jgi:hypothetical protein
MLLLYVRAGAVCQPGSVGGSIAFRVFTPAGKLITPATAKYQVGFGDAPDTYFEGTHRIRKVGSPERFERPDYFYDSTGVYHVIPPSSDSGAPVSGAFHLYVAHGLDTMFVYPPSIRLKHIWLDSIPFRPGTYHLTEFVYDAAAYVKPQRLRLSPGPLTNWQALQKPAPVMYLEQVADLGNDAFRKWQKRRSSWDTVLVKNGRKCKAFTLATRPYQDGLQRVAAGPPAYYYGWLNSRRCMFLLGDPQRTASENFQLFEIQEAVDSAYFFPRGKSFDKRSGSRWYPPRFLLDTVFYEQGAWYALVVRSFPVLRPSQSPCLSEQEQYVKCRLWRDDELTPTQLAALQRSYIAQLPKGYWGQLKASKTATDYPECDWMPLCGMLPVK